MTQQNLLPDKFESGLTHEDIGTLLGQRHPMDRATSRARRGKSKTPDDLTDHVGKKISEYYSDRLDKEPYIAYISFLIKDWAVDLHIEAQTAIDNIMYIQDEIVCDPSQCIPRNILETAKDILILKKFAPRYTLVKKERQKSWRFMESPCKISHIDALFTNCSHDSNQIENIHTILEDFVFADFPSNTELLKSDNTEMKVFQNIREEKLLDDLCRIPHSEYKFNFTGLLSRILSSNARTLQDEMENLAAKFNAVIKRKLFAREYGDLQDYIADGQTFFSEIDIDEITELAVHSINSLVLIPIFQKKKKIIPIYDQNWGVDLYRQNVDTMGYGPDATNFIHSAILGYSNRVIDAFKSGRVKFEMDGDGEKIIQQYSLDQLQHGYILDKLSRVETMLGNGLTYKNAIKKAQGIMKTK